MELQLQKRIATIREAAQLAPVVLFEGRVRHWIATNRDGFSDRVVVRRGGRIFLDLDELQRWFDEGRHSDGVPRTETTASR